MRVWKPPYVFKSVPGGNDDAYKWLPDNKRENPK
jgi:hypothetical protein